jgi:hypothetical protein
MPTQLVNTRGHYPAGYPRGGGPGGAPSYDPAAMERATDTPDLQVFKTAVQEAQSTSVASDYFSRNACARDWWYARWPNQTIDGRKWGDPLAGIQPWPWPGAADTRLRMVERVIGEHRTLMTFALRNMKWQAKSTRPAATIAASQKATTLFNWMLFSHMQSELHREMRLGISWRNAYGASLLDVQWKQMRRLDYIDVNVMGLQEFINEPAVRGFMGGAGSDVPGNIPIGENLSLLDLQDMIMDPAYADDLAVLLREVSHKFLTVREARKKLDDLRQMRTVNIPVPYVFESRPSLTALRPMVDCYFTVATGDLQSAQWHDRVEFVSETTLRDRIETAGYSAAFVEEAVDRRGPTGGTDWRVITGLERSAITNTGFSALENDIELHHFYTLVQDRGVPVRFCTVFHMDVEEPAKHEPFGYDHQQATLHPLRFELDDRPILSSQGIAEKAYTWEMELKTQYDAQSDRTALSLRPPLMTTYDQVQKMKESIQPGLVFPMRKFDEAQFMRLPPWDQVSILVIQEVENRVRNHFAIFGNDVDPDLKKLRREELTDDLISELKPVAQQIMQLFPQFLPDEDAQGVIGLATFHLTKKEIQHQYALTGSTDIKDADSEWLKEKIPLLIQLAQLDVTGSMDRVELLHEAAEAISSDFAERLIKNPQVATQAEVQEEQRAIDLIIGSGQDQPLPQGANYQLRLQTLQAKMGSITTNPATAQIIQQNPKIIQVLMNRAQFFQRQLQQQQNAQIGRMQVSQTFNKQAPQVAEPTGMLGY